MSTASWSEQWYALSMSACKKFLVSLLIPEPSVIVSCGWASQNVSFSSAVKRTPKLTRLKRELPWGSERATTTFGFYSFKYLEMPAMVPPVPAQETNAFTLPSV